jgi:hypothetical protein
MVLAKAAGESYLSPAVLISMTAQRVPYDRWFFTPPPPRDLSYHRDLADGRRAG